MIGAFRPMGVIESGKTIRDLPADDFIEFCAAILVRSCAVSLFASTFRRMGLSIEPGSQRLLNHSPLTRSAYSTACRAKGPE